MLAFKILLIFTIILQLFAVVISLRLLLATKFKGAWVLFTIAFILMVFQLITQFLTTVGSNSSVAKDTMAWMGVISSLCFTGGLLIVNSLLSYIKKNEETQKLTAQRILNTVISTEEKERRRFSKDLHDDLGPLLSSAKMSLSALSTLECSAAEKTVLQNTNNVIDEAIKSLKEVSNNLSPHILNNFGVHRAVQSFLNKLTLPAEVDIEFNSNIRQLRFYSSLEAIIYRVVCELINNALKHSSASKIEVTIYEKGGEIAIEVRDNGCGFSQEKIDRNPSKSGMGLSNIRSRIDSIRGALKIFSKEGEGTAIKINLATEKFEIRK